MSKEIHIKKLKHDVFQAISKFEDNMVNVDRKISKDDAYESAKQLIIEWLKAKT